MKGLKLFGIGNQTMGGSLILQKFHQTLSKVVSVSTNCLKPTKMEKMKQKWIKNDLSISAQWPNADMTTNLNKDQLNEKDQRWKCAFCQQKTGATKETKAPAPTQCKSENYQKRTLSRRSRFCFSRNCTYSLLLITSSP
jgi:hypothetical protein